MSSQQPVQPEDFVAQLAAQDEQRRLDLERGNAVRRTQIKELKDLLKGEQIRADILKTLADHVPLLTPPTLVETPGPADRPEYTWVLVLSDLQHGQLTSFNASGGTFEQSSAVSREQFRLLWVKFQAQLAAASVSKRITRVVLLIVGDMHEGDSMRVSQAMKVDSPVTVQCIEVNDLETELIMNLAAVVPMVEVHVVGGNHDRTSTKPGTAGLGELSMLDTFAWLGGEILARRLSHLISDGRVELVNNESWFGAAIIAGRKVVYEHGASFRSSTGSYGGVSFYSIANAAAGYARMLDGADLVVFGHFHQPMILPMKGGWGWQVVNGAFPPSTEFVQSNFKGVGRPSQWLLELHEDHGMTMAQPIYLDTEHMVQPGDFWRNVAAKRG